MSYLGCREKKSAENITARRYRADSNNFPVITRRDAAAAAAAVQARGCGNLVDVVTLMSVLPLSFADRHTASVAEATIDSDPTHWAWCTNPKCQKVIHRRAQRHTGNISFGSVNNSLSNLLWTTL